MANFKLVYTNQKTKKIEEFNILFRKATGKVAKVFWECLPKLKNDNASEKAVIGIALAKYIDADASKTTKEDFEKQSQIALMKAVTSGDLDVETVKKFLTKKAPESLEVKENEFKLYIQMLQACIDTDNMTNEQKKLIESPAESDFWQSQELINIKGAVDFFRNLIE